MMIKEKRKTVRYPVSVNINALPDPIPIGKIRNLSPDGLFIETTNLKEVGTKIDLCFTLPNSSEVIQITGEVVWVSHLPSFEEEENYQPTKKYVCETPGMGIRIISISPEHKSIIERFVRKTDIS